jgi:hypothetical protein
VTTAISAAFLSIVSVVLVVRKDTIRINYQIIAKLFFILAITWLSFFFFEFLDLDWVAVTIFSGIVTGSLILILGLKKYFI